MQANRRRGKTILLHADARSANADGTIAKRSIYSKAMAAEPGPAIQHAPSTSRALIAAALSILVVAAGAASYMALLEVPSIRRYAIPNLLLMIAGCLIALRTATKRPRWPGVLASLATVGVTLFFFASTYLLFALPQPQQKQIETIAAVDADAPAFVLPDQDGDSVAIADYWGKGPVLLVFYRGHW